MSKGSEHKVQLALTEHSSSGLVWETLPHTHTHAHLLKRQEWDPMRVWNGGQTLRRGRSSKSKEFIIVTSDN